MTWNDLSNILWVVPFLVAPIGGVILIFKRSAGYSHVRNITGFWAVLVGGILVIVGLYFWWAVLSYFLK